MSLETLCPNDITGTLNSLFGTKRPIAIVDDNGDDRHFMQQEMKFLFGETPVLAFESAADLSLYLHHNTDEDKKPCLIMLDLHMPGIDGFKMMERLKTYNRLADIPVLVMSDTTMKNEATSAIRQGALAFLPKPVTRGSFIEAFFHKDHYLRHKGES